jgi:hypothetical protein
LSAAIILTYPFYELGIAGNDYKKEKEKIDRMFLPNIILFGGDKEGSLEILKNRVISGKTLIYVCENHVCQLPVEGTEKALKQILS